MPTTTSLALPPLDLDLSPVTGWTRAHHVAVLERVLDACRRHASASGARITFDGRSSRAGADSDGLEGFARSFLGAAFRVAGEPEAAGGSLSWYADGFAAGTDPAHPDAWPLPADRYQPIVESAALALGLGLTRDTFWDRLPEPTRASTARYLGHATGARTHDNNWTLFTTVVDEVLLHLDDDASDALRRRRADEVEATLARIERWYRGDGWYSDGDGQRFDHYAGWAMHFYPLWWARLAADRAPDLAAELGARYAARARRFLEQLVETFGAEGRPLHQGRSLTYRFAALAPFWTAALHDAVPLRPGQLRTLGSSTVRHFVDGGALAPDGHLTTGWLSEYPPIAQPYSGPGSPMWASKGFAGLALPAGHPVWTATEERLPDDERAVALPVPGLALTRTRRGVVRAANHGSDHYPTLTGFDDPYYSRLAYTTHTGPVPEPDDAVEEHLALVRDDGVPSRRVQILRGAPVAADGTTVRGTSTHRPSWQPDDVERPDGWQVTTVTAAAPGVEVRLHRVTGTASGRPVVGSREGGPCVAGRAPAHGAASSGPRPAAWARSGDLTAWTVGLHGWTTARLHTTARTAFGNDALVPVLEAAGTPALLVSVVGLDAVAEPLPGVVPDVDARWLPGDGGLEVTVAPWRDGESIPTVIVLPVDGAVG
ncbi:DUF2264 domain-containing protein [Xylanimonas protaetiae]|uniref:DUF2264 domain-containing protein n=1 Tax=Xylanimonas protaetiae TaxID=2509457 RepID=A0A4P6F6Y6_9MICO|nr:DUF2264 domain-containing protein [Xylanimonas protaetiae]QAY71196.1 DUF2264 domain-containing protein [Xylanimonas protaetiae]